ncbi:hypothetical protein GCU67_07165 [Modestobacter muralis]|uniref:Uncharacterized protein n=1 Tax=Modestobacter muralis TaxID=1608614 RepID=A0A6P0ESR7_9ACTN|nr:hypothetical protein [Modestobacter muralis]NEK93955.1 hypothetical protein [Modestobacter muralis]NEN50722.1 hypothetical protein [Modestobacter muralis]
MPSTSSRRPGAAATRHRPRRPLGRGPSAAPPALVRPVQAPFAALFGGLVAVEDGFLGWLLWDADRSWSWYLLVPLLLAAGALAGAVLVLRGRGLGPVSGSAVLAWSCVLPLLGLLALALFTAALGDGEAAWLALVLVVGPLGGLVLALRRPVREWTRRGRARDDRAPGRLASGRGPGRSARGR